MYMYMYNLSWSLYSKHFYLTITCTCTWSFLESTNNLPDISIVFPSTHRSRTVVRYFLSFSSPTAVCVWQAVIWQAVIWCVQTVCSIILAHTDVKQKRKVLFFCCNHKTLIYMVHVHCSRQCNSIKGLPVCYPKKLLWK